MTDQGRVPKVSRSRLLSSAPGQSTVGQSTIGQSTIGQSTVGTANIGRSLLALLITVGVSGPLDAANRTAPDPTRSQASTTAVVEKDPFDPEYLAAEVRANPESRSARWNYGFVLFRHGEIDKADEQFRYAEELGKDAYSSLMRGVIAEQQLRYVDALNHYKIAEELPGNSGSSERATENRTRLNELLEDLRRFRVVDTRLDRDLWIAMLAFAGFALVILRFTRARNA